MNTDSSSLPMTGPRPPTLTDVGRLAGVTATTASYALRNDPRVVPATQQRVREAAAKLGYTPDPVLSALVARRDIGRDRIAGTNLVALVDDRWGKEINGGWLLDIIDGMRRGCARFGYSLSVMRIARDLQASRRPDLILHSRGVRGIVLLPLFSNDVIPHLDWKRYSVIAIGHPPESLSFHRVGIDAFNAMQMVVDHLRNLGYRRLGLAHPLGAEHRLRYEWLGSLAKEAFLADSDLEILPPCLPDAFTPEAFLTWVKENRPEAVITNFPPIIEWLRAGGWRVPTDVGVVLLNCDHTKIAVAGVSQHLDISGEAAIEQLHMLLLRGETGFATQLKELLVRPHWLDGPTLRKRRRARHSKASSKTITPYLSGRK